MRTQLRIACLVAFSASLRVTPLRAQEEGNSRVIVSAEADEIPSAYGAPPDLSHGRISNLTRSYVLAPYSFELEAGYSGSAFRHGSPAHVFTQEIEMGLPARFTAGIQNQIEHFDRGTRDRGFTLEGRYALANWNKLPLNPAISVEYRFGVDGPSRDDGELALLLSHDFSHELPYLVEWAMNIFVDREFGGRRSVNAGFAQSIEVPVILPDEKLEVGVEMQYRSGGETAGRPGTTKGFAIGPTLAWRPTKSVRFDFSPLIGCSDHAPAAQMFALVSFSFGGPETADTEIPASARAR